MPSFEWIDTEGRFRLALRPRPAAPITADLARWRDSGAQRIISLQTEVESTRWGLTEEPAVAESLGLTFERFPIYDHAVPEDTKAAVGFARQTLAHLTDGEAVVFHCLAGIGRSGMMAILTLMVAGFELEDAQSRAQRARRLPVPENELQRRWLAHVAAML